jgi:AcrR family transcriptional regulator
VSAGTRERILDAAEELFADRGIAATSLRALTRAAEANLAAVHYHFGSKESLLDAVLERHAGPANAERLAHLEQLEANGKKPALEEILAAFVTPGLESMRATDGRLALLGRLKARVEAQPEDVVEALIRKHFGTVFARFLEAMQRALPELDAALVDERFRFALGALSTAFSGNLDLDTVPGHPPIPTRLEPRIQRLIEFLAAALRAPDQRTQAKAHDRPRLTLAPPIQRDAHTEHDNDGEAP